MCEKFLTQEYLFISGEAMNVVQGDEGADEIAINFHL